MKFSLYMYICYKFVCPWAQRDSDIRRWTHIEIVGSLANTYSDYGTRTDINPWMLNLVEH